MGRVSLETLIDRSERNMGNVHAAVKDKAIYIIRKAYDEGINVQISSGFRSFARQNELYAQGRTTKGNIVTNARAGQSVHNYGLAIDYFLTTWDGSKATWNVNSDWRRVAEIGKSLGFSWGGDWSSFKDYPHLELTGGLSWRDLKAGKRPTHLLKGNSYSSAVAGDGIFENGESGSGVKKVQKQLIEAGYKLPKYGADGDYGDETEKAVRAFQKQYGLSVDGVAGPKTISKLEEVIEMADRPFKDVKKEAWYYEDIVEAKDVGIAKGLPDGTYNPEESVTKAEATSLALRAYNKALEDAIKYFKDNK